MNDPKNVNPSPGSNGRYTSLHLALAFAVASCTQVIPSVARDIYSLRPYLYLSYDYSISIHLYVHHSWIAEFLVVGSWAHFALSHIRDYIGFHTLTQGGPGYPIAYKPASNTTAIGICLWVGFHPLALYSHNDTILAFGEEEKQVLIEPNCAEIIPQPFGPITQNNILHFKKAWSISVNKSFDSFSSTFKKQHFARFGS